MNLLANHKNLGLFSVSVFIHAGLLLLVGGVVITEGLLPHSRPIGDLIVNDPIVEPEPETVADDVPLPEAQPSEMESGGGSPAQESAVPDVLVASVQNTSFTVSPGVLAPSTLSGMGRGAGAGTGSGSGSGGGVGGVRGAKKVRMFNTDIEAEKLGAVVDVSGTATPFILPTLREIQKSFDNAVVVLACGCALSVPRGVAKPFSSFDLSLPSPSGAAGYNALGYIKGTMNANEDVKRLILKLQKDPNAFLMEGNGLDVTNAIQKLVDEKCDAIYWFSDFRDGVREDLAQKIAADLKSRGIKLYIHSFTGEAIPPVQKAMVETTGGKTIVVIPKK